MNYPQGTDLQAVLSQITLLFQDKKNWKNKFEAISHLRILNKFYASEINEIFINFGNQIIESVKALPTCEVKISLMFLWEVFMSGRLVKLDERVIQYFLPILIQNSNSEKKFIKEDSNLALSEFVITCCQTDFAYEIICDKSLDFKAHQL